MSDGALDVVVRFHNIQRLHELERGVFSLIGQRYRPLHIYLTMQRFTADMVEQVRARLAPLLAIDKTIGMTLLNWQNSEPVDARSPLINLGLRSAQGRYVAFLDYDDTIYPEAYELLVTQLNTSKTAIAFAGICVKVVDDYSKYWLVREKKFPFNGKNVLDLFRENFCPIHSFVIDRSIIPDQMLFFEPLMNRNEDYDFLIRLCSQYSSNFSLMDKIIGDYYVKTDGSNTINTEWVRIEDGPAAWDRAEAFIEQRRCITPVSADVQQALGLAFQPNLTVRELLDILDKTPNT